MPHVNPTLPNQGESADAQDVSGPFLELLQVFNGHIGADNIEPGTIPNALGNSSIDTAKIQDNAVNSSKIADNSITPQKVADAIQSDQSGATAAISLVVSPASRATSINGVAQNLTLATPVGFEDMQPVLVRIRTAAARSLAYTGYTPINLTLPSATVAGKWLYLSGVWCAPDSTMHVLSVQRQG